MAATATAIYSVVTQCHICPSFEPRFSLISGYCCWTGWLPSLAFFPPREGFDWLDLVVWCTLLSAVHCPLVSSFSSFLAVCSFILFSSFHFSSCSILFPLFSLSYRLFLQCSAWALFLFVCCHNVAICYVVLLVTASGASSCPPPNWPTLTTHKQTERLTESE